MAQGAETGGRAREPEYSLGAVVRLTGLTEHTIRAWERRYGAIHPRRTEGGTRRYGERDVARLRLLKEATRAGHRIGDLADLSDAEIEARLPAPEPAEATPLAALHEAVDRMDAAALERQLGLQLGALGPGPFARSVAAPLLREVGERWARGELPIAAEHLVTATLRSLLSVALRAGTGPRDEAPRIVFATPPGERHEFGLLMAALSALGAGAEVTYLGPDLPGEETAAAAEQVGARAVALSIVNLAPGDARRSAAELRRRLPERVEVWVGGSAADGLGEAIPGVERLELAGLERRIAHLRRLAPPPEPPA